jgi:hypothetical protein
MPIRKEGSATGKVIEIEDDDLIRKEAAVGPPWDDQDEQALADENQD